jgi:hypothetical protein
MPKKTAARTAVDALRDDPATGEPWPETTPQWHDYVAAAYELAASTLGVEYFERAAQGHAIAAKSMRGNG